MATRSRGASERSTKPAAPPPFSGDALRDEQDNRERAATGRQSGENGASAQITSGSLKRREIPSFSDDRAQRIAERAYWRAEQRGFAPGRELDDWLEAEREYDASRDQSQDGRTA